MNNGKQRNGKLIARVVYIAVAGIAALSVLLCIIASSEITNGYHEMGRDMLMVACKQLQRTLDDMYEGEWTDVDGVLYKGDANIEEEFQSVLEDMKRETGLEYTLILDKNRALTTINGMKGKPIGDAAYNALRSGNTFSDFKTDINGENYYVYYTPENQGGKYVGAFFAGRMSEDIDSKISSAILTLVILAVIVTVAFVIVGLMLSNKYSKMMKNIAESVEKLASGDLSVQINRELADRRDELGIIGEGVYNLDEKLKDVISKTIAASKNLDTESTELADSASQASQASDQVTDAITEISKGAVAQAESVEGAVGDTDDIGKNIENITGNVSEMDSYAEDMKNACDKAMDALEKLIKQSADVTVSVREIGDTINSTNESAKTISEFTQAITDIATQTNLLSLNASIEAARAGDAGRGFAVVADEIRQLADQSSESADKIKSIVEKLLADSASSVAVLEKLNESFGVQAEQLDQTKANMETMNGNVANVKNTSASISGRVSSLNDAKNGLMEIISDLSAISEENAASTEETNASMEELNATFTVISEAASSLQTLSSELSDTISYFRL
ncbi:MAG: cache domain-containing protein [Lachnospiraceae bacterium]|nr:cache domain-containing protein [Lachnospiraceae bacterium]